MFICKYKILHLSIPTNCFVNAPVPLRLRVDAVIHVRVPLGVEDGSKSTALISAEMMMSTLDWTFKDEIIL